MLMGLPSSIQTPTQHGGTEDTEDAEEKNKREWGFRFISVCRCSEISAVAMASMNLGSPFPSLFSVSFVPSVAPCWVESLNGPLAIGKIYTLAR